MYLDAIVVCNRVPETDPDDSKEINRDSGILDQEPVLPILGPKEVTLLKDVNIRFIC